MPVKKQGLIIKLTCKGVENELCPTLSEFHEVLARPISTAAKMSLTFDVHKDISILNHFGKPIQGCQKPLAFAGTDRTSANSQASVLQLVVTLNTKLELNFLGLARWGGKMCDLAN